jgi:uncharacterized protein (TIGR02302 family)
MTKTDARKPARKPRTPKPPSEQAITLARFVLFMEKLWPALLPFLGAVSLFLLISLFDFWRHLPWLLHYAVIFLLVAVAVYTLVRDVSGLEWPSRQAGLARLEGDGKIQHAALQALEDRPFETGDQNNPLWQAHRKRMAKLAGKARLDKPQSTIDERDPYALRYGLVFLLVFAVFTAWGDIMPRLVDGVSPKPGGNRPVMVDLWIDPPDYTGRAPVMLVQSTTITPGAQEQIEVPEGSVLYARVDDRSGPRLFGLGKPKLEIKTEDDATRPPFQREEGTLLAETTLTQNNALILQVDGDTTSWPVRVIPDQAPVIRFVETPTTTDDNRIRLVVEIEDDYGITNTDAIILLAADQSLPLDMPAIDNTLIAKRQTIPVAGIVGSLGVRSADLNLTENEWAGLEVNLRLQVTDGTGQTAETLTQQVTLPERQFFNPLAKAIIHERRNLAIAPSSWTKTSQALEALTFAPDYFFTKPKDYLLMRTAYWDVIEKKGEYTEETVEEFWPLALQLEDEALELARRALEAAQQALREALERGAPPGEIKELIENLRTAMQNYIQALAESGLAEADGSGQSEELGSNDLDDILDSINDLSESGANNAARQMLSELEQMLQNLQISRGGSGSAGSGQSSGQPGEGQGQAGNSPGSQAMGATGDIIGSQRELADDTFEAQREQYGLDGNGNGGSAKSPEALQREQQALADRMEQLMDELGNGISGENAGDITRSFEQALQKMEEAAEALGAGNPGAANMLQEEALDALRAGAEGLAEAQRQAREGQQDGKEGDGSEDIANGSAGTASDLDPLGRPYGSAIGEAIGIPDLSDPEVARELILELRRRLSEPGRSQDEIEYLERLLERF